MDFDYDKEEKDFLAVLEAGEYKTEHLTNNGLDEEFGERDLAAFKDYLESNSFAVFAEEVSK